MSGGSAGTGAIAAIFAWVVSVALVTAPPATADFTVGSKSFPESWVLAEALALLAESRGVPDVRHRNNLGGTDIVFEALRSGQIDAYPDYTGTISEVTLKVPRGTTFETIRQRLAELGLGMSDPIGFNNSYAFAVTQETHEEYGLERISQLNDHPDLRLAFSHEFIGREDGYPGLSAHYGLRMNDVRGIQHQLAYGAIAEGKVDVIDIYTTDAQIEVMDLYLLEDDLSFFPRYDAVWLYRLDLPGREPEAFAALQNLVGVIDEPRMIRANALVVLEEKDYSTAAGSLLEEAVGEEVDGGGASTLWSDIAKNTLQHLRLVAISLFAAIVTGIPMGVLATRSRALASLTLSTAGLMQTIPSLALLAFLIPLIGIGVVPALVALFLYSLLPIVRNTYTGLTTIPPALLESASAVGLSARAQLFRVRLPMASPAIMAGIKTSAVINVGTATLAALIGAGGLGDPILTGIQLRRHSLILQGAIPAALLALLVQWGFDLLDRVIVPRGLRIGQGHSEE